MLNNRNKIRACIPSTHSCDNNNSIIFLFNCKNDKILHDKIHLDCFYDIIKNYLISFSFKYLTSVFLISGKINLEGFYVVSFVLGYYLVGYFVVGGGVGY